MSIEVSSHVWKHSKQSGSRLLLLVAIADYANAEGIAWPSIRSLCQRTRLKERYVQKMLNDLEAANEIAITRRDGSSNVIRVFFPAEDGGCTPVHRGGAPGYTRGGALGCTQNHQYEPSLEPSIPAKKRPR